MPKIDTSQRTKYQFNLLLITLSVHTMPPYRPIFPFLRYVQTTWYFNLQPKLNFAYFPDYDLLDADQKELINWDPQYSQRDISKLDAAYQSWNRGIILNDESRSLSWENIQPSCRDNYRFIRKYFHPFWSVYVLCLRILSLNNPVAEIRAFCSQRKCKRIELHLKVEDHASALSIFESDLLKQQPKVAVIIPTLNRYIWLADALRDLEQQDYKNFEVIVVDQSDPFIPTFYDQFDLDIQLIRQEEKALWLARNTAIKKTQSEYIAMYEDDVRVSETWLSNHLRCLDFFGADISAGVFFPEGQSIPTNRVFFRWAEQFATGNACLKKDVFRRIGLFDRQFEKMRMGDGEFGLRAYLEGFKSVSNPMSWCRDIKAPAGGLRQMGSWDAFRPKSLFAPRPVPSVLYFTRKYFGKRAAIQMLLNNIPKSLVPYHLKRNKVIFLMYTPISLLLFPLLMIQAMRSWKISSQMLWQGAQIESLD